MTQRTTVAYLVTLSAVAAVMILVASLQRPSVPSMGLAERSLVGAVFIASCILGISLAIRPGWARRLREEEANEFPGTLPQARGRRGHHPDCEYFESHIVRWRGRTLCAGCTGLGLGSLVSIPLMSAYIVLPLDLSVGVLQVLLASGLALVGAKYVETLLPLDRVSARLIFNSLLVVGFFLIVMSVSELSGSAALGILGVVISFLFLDTRIQLSRLRHVKTCRDCSESCKVYLD